MGSDRALKTSGFLSHPFFSLRSTVKTFLDLKGRTFFTGRSSSAGTGRNIEKPREGWLGRHGNYYSAYNHAEKVCG